MKLDSSDSDFEEIPVSKKALIEISDEEPPTYTTYEVFYTALLVLYVLAIIKPR